MFRPILTRFGPVFFSSTAVNLERKCELWVHRKWNGTSKQEYAKLSNQADDAPFQCLLCIVKENSEIVPFFFLDSHELLDLNGIALPSQLKLLGSYELKSKLKTMPNLHDYDMDENIIHTVNSNYYDVTTFAQIQKARDSLSLFHTNLRIFLLTLMSCSYC